LFTVQAAVRELRGGEGKRIPKVKKKERKMGTGKDQ
jgi:hypothetical protein